MFSLTEITLGLALLFGALGFLLSCISLSLSIVTFLSKRPTFSTAKEVQEEELASNIPLNQIFEQSPEEDTHSKEINKIVDKMFFKIKEDKEPYMEKDLD